MDWIDALLIPLIKSLIVIVGLLVGFAYMTYAERKLCARFAMRYGPNRAGPFGILQPISDAFKAIFKEEVIPTEVDKWIYLICPALAMAASLIVFAVIPLGDSFMAWGRKITLSIGDLNVGALYLVAIAGLGLYGIFLGGWSSNNNFSMMGALRTTAQMLTYEAPLGLSLVSLALITGSLRINDIIAYQTRLPLIVLQPLGFLIYFICGMAETNRSPFDLPETENELVAGYGTEYGGIKFAIFFMAEYINMIVFAGVVSTLFLGGWHGPFDQLSPLMQILWFGVKTAFILWVLVWIRSSLPRVRYDKWMRFGWKFLFPLALVNLAATAVVVAVLS
jgi:NADH-quinone oxidoreductase subunit H